MSIRGRLNQLKKVNDPTVISLSVDHLVIGSDLYSLELFYQLKKKNVAVKIASACEIELTNTLIKKPFGLRGKENLDFFSLLYPQSSFHLQQGNNLFYKDSKWREFGGRSRPEKMLAGEDFFLYPHADVDFTEIFQILQVDAESEFQQWLKDDGFIQIPQSIQYRDGLWLVLFSNGQEISCQRLYWGLSPRLFTELFRGHGDGQDRFIEFADSSVTPGKLYWRAELPSVLIEETQTLFIAQSFTHDWGHFIGEVSSHGHGQLVEFISFVDLDEATEDELGKKIRALKKSLEKIYPKTHNLYQREYIVFSDSSSSGHLNDPAFDKAKEYFHHFYFIGENAPIDQLFLQSKFAEGQAIERSCLSHFVRGLASIRQALL